MTRRQPVKGACIYCGKETTRGRMGAHFDACAARQAAIAAAESAKTGKTQSLYHLLVQDSYSGAFWLHLEMNGEASLQKLDEYLRAIWLECCGHLSQFNLHGVSYTQIFKDDLFMGFTEQRSMRAKVNKLFHAGQKIPYKYDFGSTTELLITVLGVREGKPTTKHPIALMARNDFAPPTCAECDQPAIWFCTECLWDEDAPDVFCEQHANDHEHDDMLLAIVNSPRTGVCGYNGPAEPPY